MHESIKCVFTLFIVLIACLLIGCDRKTINGAGDAQQERRDLNTFYGLDVNGDYVIMAAIGNPQELVISSNPNILPYIKSSIDDDILTIHNDDSVTLKPSVQQNLWFTAVEFHTLHLSGNTQFEMSNLNGKELECTLKGSHGVFLKGKLKKLKLLVNGKANVNAKDLKVEEADIEINGSALVGVNVSNYLKVKINGDGKVIYYDSMPKVEQTITGTGEVSSSFGAVGQKEKSPP